MSGMSFVLLFKGGSSSIEAVSASPMLSKPKGQGKVGVAKDLLEVGVILELIPHSPAPWRFPPKGL